jgi:hypothetical protein
VLSLQGLEQPLPPSSSSDVGTSDPSWWLPCRRGTRLSCSASAILARNRWGNAEGSHQIWTSQLRAFSPCTRALPLHARPNANRPYCTSVTACNARFLASNGKNIAARGFTHPTTAAAGAPQEVSRRLAGPGHMRSAAPPCGELLGLESDREAAGLPCTGPIAVPCPVQSEGGVLQLASTSTPSCVPNHP